MTDAARISEYEEHPQAKVKVDEAGRVLVPAEFRKALGIKPGDHLIMRVEDGELRLWTFREATRRVREMIAPYTVPGRSVADDLIEDRRREAERE